MSLRIGAWVVGVSALVVAACTPPQGSAPGDGGSAGNAPGDACRRFGDTCTFSPGKLGTCVQKPNCAGHDCLVCQSQH